MRRQNFMLTHAITADPVYEFATEVHAGLTKPGQKELPSKYLYDEVGSALFEVITVLPEYGLTRADARLIDGAAEEIVRAAGCPKLVVELGSGTGSKTRRILESGAEYGAVEYRPIDISRHALDTCEAVLDSVARVRIEPIEATYLDGIDIAMTSRCAGERALVLCLGSTIGNFNGRRPRGSCARSSGACSPAIRCCLAPTS